MTNYPTLLGNGGHSDSSQTYQPGYYYSNVGLGRCVMLEYFTEEDYVTQTVPVNGNVSYLSWGLSTPLEGPLTSSLTLTLKRNSLNSALAVSFGSDTTGWMTDSTHTVGVNAGDTLDFAADVGASSSFRYGGNFYSVSASFDSTDGTVQSAQLLATVGEPTAFNIIYTGEPNYVNFLGILNAGATAETDQQFYCLAAGAWQNMACYVTNNSFQYTIDRECDNDLTTILVDRSTYDGTTNSSMAISLPTSTTGYNAYSGDAIESVAVGYLLDYQLSVDRTPDCGILELAWIGAQFLATGNPAQCMIGGTPNISGLQVIASGDTYFSPLFGGGNPGPQLGRSTGLFPYCLKASFFTNFITASDAAATFTLLKNGSSSGLAVSAETGSTGYFTISPESSVSYDVGDTCANQIAVTGDTDTSITWSGAALLLTAD